MLSGNKVACNLNIAIQGQNIKAIKCTRDS